MATEWTWNTGLRCWDATVEVPEAARPLLGYDAIRVLNHPGRNGDLTPRRACEYYPGREGRVVQQDGFDVPQATRDWAFKQLPPVPPTPESVKPKVDPVAALRNAVMTAIEQAILADMTPEAVGDVIRELNGS